MTKIASTAARPASAASPAASAATKPKAASKDGFDVHSAYALLHAGKVPAGKTAVPGVAESFPVAALDKIQGRGLSGDTFLLDGGSLAAMKLQARRVTEQGQPGFDLIFRVDGAEHGRLVAAMQKVGAVAGKLEFSGLALGASGVADYSGKKGELSHGTTYAPKDISSNDSAWTKRVTRESGASLELVEQTAAYSARGLVRVRLRGDDKKCAAQLADLAKSLGLSHLFAPPTDKAKKRFALMRALWQADPVAAKKLSAEDLNKLKESEVEAALKKAGFDAERIAGLRFTDVSPTHFTVIDPRQAEELKKAGASYLYSTVEKIEHVVGILENGQKSSLRRYSDGFIFDGMSTNEDFSSGGGAGVFTRLVTTTAIIDGGTWTGRRFKVLLKPEVLARTDWYGWSSDMFGQAWGLQKKANFGKQLFDTIDDGSSYEDYNELIFRDSIGPQYIGAIIATSESDRAEMLAALKAKGIAAPDGTPLEDFVICAPSFMPFGPPPFDVTDPVAFANDALAQAKKGDAKALKWFLNSRPDPAVLGDVQARLLESGKDELHEILKRSLERGAAFHAPRERVLALLEKLGKSKAADASGKKDALIDAFPAAFLSLDIDAVAKRLDGADKSEWSGPFYGVSPEQWLGILGRLASTAVLGESKSFDVAMGRALPKLLPSSAKGLVQIFEAHPPPAVAKAGAVIAKEISALAKETPSARLVALLAAEKDPAVLERAELELIAQGSQNAVQVLPLLIAKNDGLCSSGAELAKAFKGLSPQSPMRQYLLDDGQRYLAESGQKTLIAALEAYFQKSSWSDQQTAGQWMDIADKLAGQGAGDHAVSWALGRAAWKTIEQGDVSDLARLTAAVKELDLGAIDAKLAKSIAAGMAGGKSSAHLSMVYVVAKGTKAQRAEVFRALIDSGKEGAVGALEWLKRQEGGLPLAGAELRDAFVGHAKKTNEVSRWFLRAAGPALLLDGSAATLAVFEAKAKTQWELQSTFGVSESDWIAALAPLSAKGGKAANDTKAWLLRCFGARLVEEGNAALIGSLRASKTTPAELGLEGAQLLTALQRAGEALLTAIQDAEYDDDAKPPEGMSEAVKWLLSNGGDEADPALVAELLAKIPEWQESGEDWKPFLDRLSYLGPSYSKAIKAAAKKLAAQ